MDTATDVPIWTHGVTNSSSNETISSTVSPLPQVHQDLMWLVPTLFGMFFFLIGMAWFLFYCIKKFELAALAFCYRKFGLCPPDERSKMLYNSLGEDNETDSDTLYMRDKLFTVTSKDGNMYPGVRISMPNYSTMSPVPDLILDSRVLKPPPSKTVQ
ncbi:uncharacterized protein LOC132558583 [Ylistrum balloti]|uniref:uncharacterized protein LOC132558583 n=1 Tax=Ylistrum balloti TaxID=509963 RepID=UPI002905E6CD|nr:uncharacterized protein LOC132558583 [Ylistrum balloti]